MSDHDRLVVRPARAAELLDTPLETVRYWLKRDRIPSFRIGRSVYIKVADLEAFIEEHIDDEGDAA